MTRRDLLALVAGTLFGFGLALSQMVNPAKVLAFLDLAGAWDPSLAFVMLGAVAVTFAAFPAVLRRSRPVLAETFALPTKREIDARLISGAAVFGVGWGLVGLCPGPAVASLAYFLPKSVLFLAAMFAGAALARRLPQRPAAAVSPGA